MRAYLAFTKKEIMESIRTYKVLIMLMVFMFFGMLAPLIAKLTPKLLESLMTDGIQIVVADPTAFDSWAQFFKTISQLGFIVVTILFSSMMANEFNQGTLINIFTKGLPRSTVILSKFTVASIIWTFSYLISFSLTYLYTAYFWSGTEIDNLLSSVLCLWLFGILLLAIILLGGALFRSSYGCLMFVVSFVAILFLLNSLPNLQIYNPVELISKNMTLLGGDKVPKDLNTSILTSILLTVLSIITSIGVFDKKQIY
jgi:ABC-2 type transport system permease protein